MKLARVSAVLFAASVIWLLGCAGVDAAVVAATTTPPAGDPGTQVSIAYGRYASELATAVLAGLGATAVWAFRFLPAHVRWAVTLIQADQLLEKALAKARKDIAENLSAKTWSVDMKNAAVANALRFAVRHYEALVARLGGAELVKEKLEARLQEWIEKSVGAAK